MIIMATYSKLVKKENVKLSNDNYGIRTHEIDTVTIHCTAGEGTAMDIINILISRNCSSNYTIGYDGSIGVCVEEEKGAWTSSDYENDNRAITIEVSSKSYHPYEVTAKAYDALIKLLADICTRNNNRKLIWFGSKNATLNYNPKPNEMRMTVHRWFSNKS